jgi:hypothetical protein
MSSAGNFKVWSSVVPRTRIALALAALIALAGCRSKPQRVAIEVPLQVNTPNLDELIMQTTKGGQAIMLLVTELGQSTEDDSARTAFEEPKMKDDSIVRVLLDISSSRNRAEATRFHITQTPVLLGLSSRGVIASRDEKPITVDLVRKRISDLPPRAHELDTKLEALEKPIAANATDITAQLVLADFLLAQHNAHEAVPHLEAIAHSESSDPPQRLRAWVDLAQAHLWIAEPEKARHEAKDLMAKLGPNHPEAIAGGNLVLGTQDTNGKRFPLARQEFEAAIAAAPESAYAKQAREALAKLPPLPASEK